MNHGDLAKKLSPHVRWANATILRELSPSAEVVRTDMGCVIAPVGETSGAWLLIEGRAEAWIGNARAGTYSPGQLLGAAAALGGGRAEQLVALTDVVLLRVEAERLRHAITQPGESGRALLHDIASDAQGRAEGVGDALVRLTHQPFRGGHQLAPPPYSTGHAKVRIIAVEWPERLRNELPPRMEPIREPALLVIARLQHLRPWQADPLDGPEFTEAGLLLPVDIHNGDEAPVPGLYAPWAWPNNLMSLFMGREMFGLAKTYGNVYESSGDHPRAVLRMDGRPGLDLRFTHLEPEDILSRTDEALALVEAISGRHLCEVKAWPLPSLQSRLDRPGHRVARARFEQSTSAREREQFVWPDEADCDDDALRMLKAATRAVDPLSRMVTALPEHLRSRTLYAWQRQFETRVEGHTGRWDWDPSQFVKDGITTSRLELRTLETVEWFELTEGHDIVPLFGPTPLLLRPVSRLGIRLRGVFAHHAGDTLLSYLDIQDDLGPEERDALRVVFERSETPEAPHVDAPGGARPLPEALVTHLRRRTSLIDLRRGEILFEQGQGEGSTAWLVVQGQIDEWRGDAYLGARGPGQLVGEVGHFETARAQRVTSAQARTDAQLRPVTREVLDALRTDPRHGPDLTQHVVEHAEGWTRYASADLETATQQVFTDHRARFAPGPYSGEAELYTIPCLRPTDGRLEMGFPPRMRWSDGLPICLLLISRFREFRPTWATGDFPSIDYTETGLMVPTQVLVDGEWQFRVYFPWLFPSNIMATFVGRELYGYPKRYANTLIEEDRLLLRLGGKTALDIPIRQHHVPQPAPVRDTLRLLGALGVPYEDLLRGNQSTEPNLDWRRSVPSGRHRPIRESLRGLAALPGILRSVISHAGRPSFPLPMAGWRRSFAPEAQIPESALSGSAAWDPRDFDVDALVASTFKVDRLDGYQQQFLELTHGHHEIAVALPGEPVQGLTPLQGMATRSHFQLTMGVDTSLVDFRGEDLEPREKERLAFGPNARRRFGE